MLSLDNTIGYSDHMPLNITSSHKMPNLASDVYGPTSRFVFLVKKEHSHCEWAIFKPSVKMFLIVSLSKYSSVYLAVHQNPLDVPFPQFRALDKFSDLPSSFMSVYPLKLLCHSKYRLHQSYHRLLLEFLKLHLNMLPNLT